MDTGSLERLGLPAEAAEVVAGYLSELDRRLRTRRRVRAEIVDELTDGLVCDISARIESGQAPREAACDAVTESGLPSVVAGAFSRQLAVSMAHRAGLGLVVTGPLVGLTWLAAVAGGRDLPSAVSVMLSQRPLLLLALVFAVPAAIVAASASGWAARWIAVPPRVATAAALLAVTCCAAGDLLLITSVATTSNGSGFGALTVAALGASVVRLSSVVWAGRRIALLRAASS